MPYPYQNPYGFRSQSFAPTQEKEAELGKAIKRGLRDFPPAIDRTHAAIQGSLGLEQEARANLEEARRAELANQQAGLDPRVGRLEQIRTDQGVMPFLEDAGDYAAGMIGGNLPLLGSMALGAGVGGLAGRALGSAKAGAWAGAAVPYETTSVAESSRDIMDDPDATGTFQERSRGALATGTAKTALGLVPFGVGAQALKAPGMSRLQRGAAVGGGAMLTEGLTETGEELIGKLGHQQFNPTIDPFSAESGMDYANAFAGGALLGGPTGFAAGVLAPKRMSQAAENAVRSGVEDGKTPQDALEGFIGQNFDVLDDNEIQGLRDSLPNFQPSAPRGRMQRRVDQMEADEELNLAYSNILGVDRTQYEANKQKERAAYFDQHKEIARLVMDGTLSPEDEVVREYAGYFDPKTGERVSDYGDPETFQAAWAEVEAENRGRQANPDTLIDDSGETSVAEPYDTNLDEATYGNSLSPDKLTDQLNESEPQSPQYILDFKGLPWHENEDTSAQMTATMSRIRNERLPDSYKQRRIELDRADPTQADELDLMERNFEESNPLRAVPFRKYLEGMAPKDENATEWAVETALREYIPAVKDDEQRAYYETHPEDYLDQHRVLESERMAPAADPEAMETITSDELYGRMTDSDKRKLRAAEADLANSKEALEGILWDQFDDPEGAKNVVREFEKQKSEIKLDDNDSLGKDSPAMRRYMALINDPEIAEIVEPYQAILDSEAASQLRAEIVSAKERIFKLKRTAGEVLRSDKNEARGKRIPVRVYSEQKHAKNPDVKVGAKEDDDAVRVTKLLDVMQAAIRSQKTALYDSENPRLSMVRQVLEGIGSVLASSTTDVKLTAQGIPEETVVYTSKEFGQVTWGEVQKIASEEQKKAHGDRGLKKYVELIGETRTTSADDKVGQRESREKVEELGEGLEAAVEAGEPQPFKDTDKHQTYGGMAVDPGSAYKYQKAKYPKDNFDPEQHKLGLLEERRKALLIAIEGLTLNNTVTQLRSYEQHLAGLRDQYAEVNAEIKALRKLPMNYAYGKWAREGIKSKHTFDAVMEGERTATTRKPVHAKGIHVGRYMLMIDKSGRTAAVQVKSVRTINLSTMDEAALQEWSKKEGWSVQAGRNFGETSLAGDVVQIEFELVDFNKKQDPFSRKREVIKEKAAATEKRIEAIKRRVESNLDKLTGRDAEVAELNLARVEDDIAKIEEAINRRDWNDNISSRTKFTKEEERRLYKQADMLETPEQLDWLNEVRRPSDPVVREASREAARESAKGLREQADIMAFRRESNLEEAQERERQLSLEEALKAAEEEQAPRNRMRKLNSSIREIYAPSKQKIRRKRALDFLESNYPKVSAVIDKWRKSTGELYDYDAFVGPRIQAEVLTTRNALSKPTMADKAAKEFEEKRGEAPARAAGQKSLGAVRQPMPKDIDLGGSENTVIKEVKLKADARPTKIISGGQSGADVAGLVAARRVGIETGGTAPKGYKTEVGNKPILAEYGLSESESADYRARTEDNVINSDATVVFYGSLVKGVDGGSKKTVDLAKKHGRAVTTIYSKSVTADRQLKHFLNTHKPKTLNVAGNRESVSPGIAREVADILENVFSTNDIKRSEIPGAAESIERILAKDDPKRTAAHQKVVDAMTRRLGLPVGIRVVSTAEGIEILKKDREGTGKSPATNNGFTTRRKGQIIIYVNPLLSEEAALETLGHEIGHIVLNETWNSTPARVIDAVLAEYQEWRKQFNKDSTVYDVVSKRLGNNVLASLLFSRDLDVKLSDRPVEEQEYILAFDEWFSDNVGRWMVTDAKPGNIVQQFFKHVADIIKDLFSGLIKEMNTPAASVQVYMDNLYQRDVQLTFDGVPDGFAFSDMLPDKVDPISASAAVGATGPNWNKAQSIRAVAEAVSGGNGLTEEEVNILRRDVQRPYIRRQLIKFYARDSSALDKIDMNDSQAMVSLAFHAWMAGELKLSKKQEGLFWKLAEYLAEVLGIILNSKNAESLMRVIASGTAKEEGRPHYIQTRVNETALQQTRKMIETASTPALKLLNKVGGSAEMRMRGIKNAAIHDLWKQFYTSPDSAGGTEGFFSARHRMRGRFEERMHRIFDGSDKELGNRVVRMLNKEIPLSQANAAEKKAVMATYGLLQEIFKYTVEAGVSLNHGGKEYFPRIYDVEYIEKHSDEFVGMLMSKYKQELIEYGKAMQSDGKEKAADPEAVARRIYTALTRNKGEETGATESMLREDGDDPLGWPANDRIKERSLGWIKNEDVAPFLSKDLGLTLSTYIEQMVKRSEYNRRFGVGTGRKMVTAYMAEAAKLGATKEELDTARDAVMAAIGTLGADINPTLHKTQGVLMVLQNWMVLGLATFASLVDPLGIAVRGDLDTAWTALKAGIREAQAAAKGEKTDLSDMAGLLGVNELHNTVEALGFEYGGYYVTGTARKWNERLFSLNMLTKWTRGTRTMALAGALKFLEKHGNFDFNKNSERWMTDLGLRKGDVRLDKEGKLIVLSHADRMALKENSAATEEFERDERVRIALNRWVDEAILRPDAAQRPIWASDPHWMLIFHLKAFTYSFHERILRRVGSELMQGNYAPAVTLLSYVPAMLIAEGLRNTLQGDDLDDVLGKDAGLFETSHYLAQRSGLYGLGQFGFDLQQGSRYGDTPLSVLGGPTLENGLRILEAATTESTTDDKNALVRSLPLNNVWKDWGWFQ